MAINNALAGIAVNDLDSALVWYQQLFNRAADSRPMPEVAEWKFPNGGWIQIFQDRDRAGSSSVTLCVESLDDEVFELSAKAISPGWENDSPLVKTVIVKDPDGNQLVFAQALTDSIAS
ncbi:MAG: hypothetical protein JWM78_421 [Verrucomicrobiaceae bacterium]|nr:hypothetical protein [Verrucomicrobiaceae bacterium]